MTIRTKAALGAAGTVALLGLAGPATAATVPWIGTAGNWNDPANWNHPTPGSIPTTADDGRISNGGTATISGDHSVGSVTVADTTGTTGNLVMTGGSLTTTNTDIRIGGNGNTTGGTGTFTQSGGVVNMNAGNLNLGLGTLAAGTYNMSGGSLQINSANIIAVGNRGNGNLNMTGGTVYVRSAGTNSLTGLLNVGRNPAGATANGNLNLSGGTIAVANVRFGNGATSTASVNLITVAGTGRLITDSISVQANHGGSNTFNFTGGTINAETISIPLTNAGGRLAPMTVDFLGGAQVGATNISQLPIDPIGITTFLNNSGYTQGPTGILEIDIIGVGSHDRVDIGGGANAASADLAGTIAVNLLGGFDPALGQTFDVLTADTITNTALATGLTPSGHTFVPSIESGGDGRQILRLTVAEVPEPGGFVVLGAASLGLASRGARKRKPKR